MWMTVIVMGIIGIEDCLSIDIIEDVEEIVEIDFSVSSDGF